MAGRLICVFALILLSAASSFAAPDFTEAYRIFIENKNDGRIAVSVDQGKIFMEAGKVLVPVNARDEDGYSASRFIATGEVAASAINAIHIKAGRQKAIFSILPKEFLNSSKKTNSYLNKSSSIYTNISMNHSIFGGSFSPVVGSEVLVNGISMPDNYFPKVGDWFMIQVSRPQKYPVEIVFQNKFQGKVVMKFDDGAEENIAYVLKPVAGVGRFAGTQYLNAGRIRANHAGVIDISISNPPQAGGFQIVPAAHAEDPEMKKTRIMNQWMVVGPEDLSGKPLEGMAPLFKNYLKPSYNEEDIFAQDWEEKLLSHFLVEVKIKDAWQPIPIFAMDVDRELPPEANTFLKDVEEIRILFPLK